MSQPVVREVPERSSSAPTIAADAVGMRSAPQRRDGTPRTPRVGRNPRSAIVVDLSLRAAPASITFCGDAAAPPGVPLGPGSEAADQADWSLHELLQHVPFGYHSLDATGLVIDINDKELRWLGYARDEVVGRMRFANLLPLRVHDQFEKAFALLRKCGYVHNFECAMQRKDGTTFPTLVDATAVRNADGEIVRTHAIVQDISERKRAEPEQAESGAGHAAIDSVRMPALGALTTPEGPPPSAFDADQERHETDRMLLTRYAPATLVVDEDLEVHQFRGRAGTYLEHASGSASLNLQQLAPPALLIALKAALRDARTASGPVRRQGVRVEMHGAVHSVSFEVSPFRVRDGDSRTCYLVVFEEPGQRAGLWERLLEAAARRALSRSEETDELKQLRRELDATREFVQSIAAEREDAKKELEQTREAAQSRNEQLQIATEKFETTREELKSSHEELATANEELRRYAARLLAISRRLIEVQEAEQRTLANHLHDLVGQNLTALNINLNLMKGDLSFMMAGSGDRIDDSLRLVADTVESVRNVMVSLRPQLLDDYGLVSSLRWYVEQFTRRTGLDTRVTGLGSTRRPQAIAEEVFFRIAQEALANAAKYADPTKINVILDTTPDMIRLTVADDGIGFDPAAVHPAKDHGWGLVIMHERATMIGANLIIESAPGRGTRVIVTLRDGAGGGSPQGVLPPLHPRSTN